MILLCNQPSMGHRNAGCSSVNT